MSGLLRRLLGSGAPTGFTGSLDKDEAVVAYAAVRGGGHVVVTSRGLWVPDGEGTRRIGWHLISKASWSTGVFVITEAEEVEQAGAAVILADLPPIRCAVEQPGKVPQAVHQRVTGSILSSQHHDLPGGGAWFVQRRVPGRDGMLLQVRPDADADVDAVRTVAAEVAAKIAGVRSLADL